MAIPSETRAFGQDCDRVIDMGWLRNTTVLTALCLFAVTPVAALSAEEERSDPGTEARELARDSIEKLMRAMELLLDSIPQYEAPEITEEGDIIIRRKRNPEAPNGEPGPEQTET